MCTGRTSWWTQRVVGSCIKSARIPRLSVWLLTLQLQVDVSTFRSQAPLGPPTVRTAIAITKSKAKAILSAPTPPAALRKPKDVSAQSTAARKNPLSTASGSGNVRKRISDAMELDNTPPAPKRPKADGNAPPQVVTAPKVAPPVARAPPSTAQRPPPVVPTVRKAPPKTTSLFVPKKVSSPSSRSNE